MGAFRVGVTIIEFVGLKGKAEYDSRFAAKMNCAESLGIQVIVITPKVLGNL